MDTARIAELLAPFLSAPIQAEGAPSSRTLRGWETPNRIRRESAVESASDRFEPALSGAKGRTANDDLYQHISTYIDLLLRWNARINLTAIRDPEQIVTRHFGESLYAARVLFPRSSSVRPVPSVVKSLDTPRVADLGSGAGFPGVPLKLWAPQISLTLIESNHKKTAFLREVTRTLTLTNIDIQNTRAETLPEQSFDLVTLRAVERFEQILPVAAALLAHAGRLALLIGASQLPEAELTLPDMPWQDPIAIPLSSSRIIAVATRS